MGIKAYYYTNNIKSSVIEKGNSIFPCFCFLRNIKSKISHDNQIIALMF